MLHEQVKNRKPKLKRKILERLFIIYLPANTYCVLS